MVTTVTAGLYRITLTYVFVECCMELVITFGMYSSMEISGEKQLQTQYSLLHGMWQ